MIPTTSRELAEALRRTLGWLPDEKLILASGITPHEQARRALAAYDAQQSQSGEREAVPVAWIADAIHIHNTVAKRWQAWSDEDKRFIALALCGEAGELANLIKKDWRDNCAEDRWLKIAEELVDVRIYLELLARAYRVDLDQHCAAKIPDRGPR